MLPEDPRQQGRCSNPKNPYHKALLEIRKSLMPFANEAGTSSGDAGKHMAPEPPFVGFEEVRRRHLVCLCLVVAEGRAGMSFSA